MITTYYLLDMTTSGLKFSTTTKRKPLLIYDGYMYTLNRDRTNVKKEGEGEKKLSLSFTIVTSKCDNIIN
jgi:hypothetical protein